MSAAEVGLFDVGCVDPDRPWSPPTQAHPDDAGLDLYASQDMVVHPGTFVDVPTNTWIDLPPTTWGLLTGRSSTLRTHHLLVAQGVIDEGYTGELFFGCWNLGTEPVQVQVGTRLAQLIIVPRWANLLVMSTALTPSVKGRGAQGFGSSGR